MSASELPDRLAEALAELASRRLTKTELQQAVSELRRSHPEHHAEIDAWVASQLLGTGLPDSGVPTQIGPYRIVRLLGEGGMGAVYEGEQSEPVRRKVALKVIKLGMDSKGVVARFEQERQALALMTHDGIAKVFDCGTTERGQPYFAMELVKGVPLQEFCDRNKLPLPDRLELVQQVCAAVAHAHQKGVVHRDLKSANVLVSDAGGRAQVKVIDFGLAKAMAQRLAEHSYYTEVGQVVGTPEYMAPEQADPTNADVDTRADIYSIGVMLYEVLVGSLPFPGRELRRAGSLEMQRVLREVEPQKPSTRVSTGGMVGYVAAERRMSAPALLKALRYDLDWVVLKAIEKDRNRRYDTANALAADLQRFLDHEPVVAGPPSAGYRLRKLIRRHRGQVVAGTLVLLTLVGGGIATFVQYLRAEEQRAQADENANLYSGKVRDFDLIADVVEYEKALVEAEGLWPATAAAAPALAKWLKEADRVLARETELQRTVNALRARVSAPEAQGRASAPARLETETEVGRASETFLLDSLTRLLQQLPHLRDVVRVDVASRLRWAEGVNEWTFSHPHAGTTWQDARDAIAKADGVAASALYRASLPALGDDNVLGLVPIGMNPVTRLWEFYDLRSAWDGVQDPASLPIPSLDADGNARVDGATGIVFVLVPGGKFMMGAQATDPNGANYDSQANKDEKLHETPRFPPFLLARHELTQGQWKRLMTWNVELAEPSFYRVGTPNLDVPFTEAHPVEQVDWTTAQLLLQRHGMTLPTETQWEYACRAGTNSPWCVDANLLRSVANVADESVGPEAPFVMESWNDGYPLHAPVDAAKVFNAFGMHFMHGNVWEWCFDVYDGGDPNAKVYDRVYRGGSFGYPARFARSSNRGFAKPSIRQADVGLRPARRLPKPPK